MGDLREEYIRRFLEIHVCTPLDIDGEYVYHTAYNVKNGLTMNRTSLARRTQIIGALVEGNSIRSTERMTNTHRETIMRLLVEIGEGWRTW